MKKLLLLPFLLGFSVPAFAEVCKGVEFGGHCYTPEEMKKANDDFKKSKRYRYWKNYDYKAYECKDFIMAMIGNIDGTWGSHYYVVRKRDNLIFNNYDASDSGKLKTAKKYCKNPGLPWAPWKEPKK